jgi:hypothetical protein
MLGFPLSLDGGANESIEIWRLDPDKESGAEKELEAVLNLYHHYIRGQEQNQSEGNSLNNWCPKLPTPAEVKHIWPLDFSAGASDGSGTLNGLLNDDTQKHPDSQLVLDLFFRPADLTLPLNSGFYQKPFIGSALMAVYAAEAMRNAGSKTASYLGLDMLSSQAVRFFLCGSLHGGTGAACVPIMASFLKRMNSDHWKVAACLMAPYSYPPPPEDIELGEYGKREYATPEELEGAVEACYQANRSKNIASFQNLNEEGQKGLIRQMLTGALAKREDLELRAQNALRYYEQGLVPCDLLFYVGAPEPKEIKTPWSNGGATQRNPPMYAETVAAVCAMQFFAAKNLPGSTDGKPRPILPASTKGMKARCLKLGWGDLPIYQTSEGKDIYPERAILTTATIAYTLRTIYGDQLRVSAGRWDAKSDLRDWLSQQGDKQPEAVRQLLNALTAFDKLLFNERDPMGLIGNKESDSEDRGWDPAVSKQLRGFFLPKRPEEIGRDAIYLALNKQQPLPYGEFPAKLSMRALTEVAPTRKDKSKWLAQMHAGAFMRELWNAIYQSQSQA